jgi:oxalate decarboxylase/phosphoglucose isomerase-like protein (cupin superfamily)
MPDPHATGTRWTLDAMLAALPLPATAKWPDGVFDLRVFANGDASLSLFAPRGGDRQTAHAQDEFYIVANGSAELHVREADGKSRVLPARPGDALHVAAGVEHRFHAISGDFAAWVVFFPQGSA